MVKNGYIDKFEVFVGMIVMITSDSCNNSCWESFSCQVAKAEGKVGSPRTKPLIHAVPRRS